jgi:uridine kinase
LAQIPELIVGIAGGTASGKTTLAKRIAASLGERCLLISHDLYYLDVRNPAGHNYDAPEALDNALLAEHLDLLAAGKPAPLPIYDFSTHKRQAEVQWVQPTPVVLLEGILILAIPEIRERCSLKVFVQAPEAIRLERRIARDKNKRGRSRESVLAQYRQTVEPMHRIHVAPSAGGVDLLLSGTGAIEDAENRLMEALRRAAPGSL